MSEAAAEIHWQDDFLAFNHSPACISHKELQHNIRHI